MSTQTHILIVEDDREIASLVGRYLRSNDIRVTHVRDGREMDRVMAAGRIDLVLLDIMLPGEDGLSICRRIRGDTSVPVIIVSARGDEVDRVIGLEVGADDYLPKPFGSRELLARIRAVLRRTTAAPRAPASRPGRFRFRGWLLDSAERRLLSPDSVDVTLTAAEFDLLTAFCERPGLVLSRDQLVDITQGRTAGPFERSVDILVSRLRRKLGASDERAELIRTVRSEGYVFSPEVVRE